MGRGARARIRAETPERRCIATGQSQPKAGLIRFVVGPDGAIVPDVLGRLPGRGIWVSADRKALETAVRKNLFARAARRPVTVPADLVDLVERLLAKRTLALLSMARKADLAVAGFEKTKAWLETGEAEILVQARDGSDRQRRKLRPPKGAESLVDTLSAAEIGLAFGREHVIHAALRAGGLTTGFVEEAARLSGVRETDGGKAAGKGTEDV